MFGLEVGCAQMVIVTKMSALITQLAKCALDLGKDASANIARGGGGLNLKMSDGGHRPSAQSAFHISCARCRWEKSEGREVRGVLTP